MTQPGPEIAPPIVWSPPPDAGDRSRIGAFLRFCGERTGRDFDDYDALWSWSVGEGLEDFWSALWQFFEVEASAPYGSVLTNPAMPGARWFEGARLNYAQHALRAGRDRPDEVAIASVSQSRDRIEMTWGQLTGEVARVRSGLAELGGRSRRSCCRLPAQHRRDIVAFLATASLGATWTSCAPEFGVPAVLDRFGQVEPTVLVAVDGYRHGSKVVSRVDELAAIRAGLASLQHTVAVPYLDGRAWPRSRARSPGTNWARRLSGHSSSRR